ncbi:MAG TPA: NfeD family protein [Stenomitos sp.]
MLPWHYWVIAGFAALVVEIFTPGFFMACLGIGCFLGGLVALLHGALVVQALTFVAGSALSLAVVRPLLARSLATSEAIATNADALVGKSGRVVERIDPHQSQGRVLVEGEDWWATSLDQLDINVDERVRVIQVDGSRLVVERD